MKQRYLTQESTLKREMEQSANVLDMNDDRKKNVNLFRRCKRYFRKKILWNTWHMRYQMRVHLISLFILFLLIYAIFMVIYSYEIY